MAFRYLKEFDGRRDNNFTVIRIFLALMVLFGHSYPISGKGIDPVSRYTVPYTWVGELAVGCFFAISGFLVTASFVNRGPIQYLLSRSLRMYPAIIVHCLVAILIIGPLGASVGLIQYFSTETGMYLLNAPLWTWQVNLPYNFLDRPFAGSSNGSMWTLPVEIRSYVIVLGLGMLGVWRTRLLANIVVFALCYIVLFGTDLSFLFAGEERYRQPLVFFLLGCLTWINRDVIPLSAPIAVALLFIPCLFLNTQYWLPVHALAVTYIIFYLVYRTPYLNVDKLGDISFGVYIYAWPVQQLVWSPGQDGLTNALIATAVVVPVAYLSWRWVEEPALNLKALFNRRVVQN